MALFPLVELYIHSYSNPVCKRSNHQMTRAKFQTKQEYSKGNKVPSLLGVTLDVTL